MEAAMGGPAGTDARVLQGVPWATGAQYEKDGIDRLAILDTGAMAPQRVRLARRQQWLDTRPQLVGDAPVTVDFRVVVMHGQTSCSQRFFATGYHQNGLLG